jgi:transcription elongation factor Elf1
MAKGLRAQTTRPPGLPCPDCNTLIEVDPISLLAAAPIICASCGLELRVNLEESAQTLDVLAENIEEITAVHSMMASKFDDEGSPSGGGRAPGRRSSNRKRRPEPARKRRQRK